MTRTRTLVVAYSRQGRDRGGVDLSRNSNYIQSVAVGVLVILEGLWCM